MIASTNAMTAAINTTPNPNINPADPGSTTPSDAQVTQQAENVGDRATMPDLKVTLRQLEKKYKHAADIGETHRRGASRRDHDETGF